MARAIARAAKERQIIFSGPLIPRLLDDTKTQTRRLLNPQPDPEDYGPSSFTVGWYEPTVEDSNGVPREGPEIFGGYTDDEGWKCPYGGPGDRLWVRETFDWFAGKIIDKTGAKRFDKVVYRADGAKAPSGKWTPAIYMPRWASRITLLISDVRLERLQQITNADAQAEGMHPAAPHRHGREGLARDDGPPDPYADRHLTGSSDCFICPFRVTWNQLNGPRGYAWDRDCWVWVISFERVRA